MMTVDRCSRSEDGNHIFRLHATGCGQAKFAHHHCVDCGLMRTFNDITKEWK